MGLFALLVRAGLPVPAEPGSTVPLYSAIYSAIGDEQDLARDLSTFSAHLTTLRAILENAREGSLVLVDEIAADTDPREGAALAAAVLDQLVEHSVQVLVTTHLEELKAIGLGDERFANARVGLDPTTLAPTFRLELGAAGVSSALEIAARVGLPVPVLERAKRNLHGGSALSTALEKLEGERRAGRIGAPGPRGDAQGIGDGQSRCCSGTDRGRGGAARGGGPRAGGAARRGGEGAA